MAKKTYTFETPTDSIAMRALISQMNKTTSFAKASAIKAVFTSMACKHGNIRVGGKSFQWNGIDYVYQLGDRVPQRGCDLHEHVAQPEAIEKQLNAGREVESAPEPMTKTKAPIFEQAIMDQLLSEDGYEFKGSKYRVHKDYDGEYQAQSLWLRRDQDGWHRIGEKQCHGMAQTYKTATGAIKRIKKELDTYWS